MHLMENILTWHNYKIENHLTIGKYIIRKNSNKNLIHCRLYSNFLKVYLLGTTNGHPIAKSNYFLSLLKLFSQRV